MSDIVDRFASWLCYVEDDPQVASENYLSEVAVFEDFVFDSFWRCDFDLAVLNLDDFIEGCVKTSVGFVDAQVLLPCREVRGRQTFQVATLNKPWNVNT